MNVLARVLWGVLDELPSLEGLAKAFEQRWHTHDACRVVHLTASSELPRSLRRLGRP